MTKEKRGRGRPPLKNPKFKVVVYLESQIIEELDDVVKKNETTRSEFVSMILKRSMNRRAVK